MGTDGFGTGDTVIIGGGIIEIIDLKYGQGVKVSADKNSQLRDIWLRSIERIRLPIRHT